MKILPKLPKKNKTIYFPLSLFIFSLFLIFPNLTSATTYYISNSGSDTNNGTTESTPWKTIAKVNATTTFQPGDNILFKRGDTWRESLTVPSSGAPGNPITYGDYGNGEKPIIDGADVITGMTNTGSNIWQKTGITIQPNLMYLNGTFAVKETSIVACDTHGEWFWDSADSILYIYSATDPNGNVELGQRSRIFNVGTRKYITVNNLILQHSNDKQGSTTYPGALSATWSGNLTVTNCTIHKNAYYGLYVLNSSNVTIDNNNISSNENIENAGIFQSIGTTGMRDIKFTNNQCNYGRGGLWIGGGNKVSHISNVDIHGNHFEHTKSAGLYIVDLDSSVVYNNYINSNGDSVDTREDYGIGITSCDNTDIYNNTILNTIFNDAIQVYADNNALYGSANNLRIFRNYISNTQNHGIAFIQRDTNSIQNLQVFYNIIDSSGGYGILATRTLPTVDIDTSYIFNNTIYGCGKGCIYVYDNYPLVIKNNIFSNIPTNWPSINAYYSSTGLTTENNLYYRGTGGSCISFNATGYDTTEVLTLEPTAQTGNPLFTNPANGDFTLQSGSPAINAGTDVGLTEDILGNPIVGLPDIGAYEYQTIITPPPTVDTEKPTITSFTIPTTSTTLSIPITTLTASDNIAVTGYLLTETSTTPSTVSGSWTTTKPTSYTFTTEGTKTLYVFIKDEAGNISNSSSDQVIITLPIVTPPPSGGGGGGGGGSTKPKTCSSTETLINNTCKLTSSLTLSEKASTKDVKKDGTIDILDFNIVMVNWNKTYSLSSSLSKGDLTGDGKIDIFDINQIMVYWGVKY